MAYIPDEWVIKRLDIAQSAQQILFYYCARADNDTGKTNVSAQRVSQDLGIRKDHIDEHDRKLVREGFVTITKDENGGRTVRLLSPWQPRAERNGHLTQKVEKKTVSQDLGKPEQPVTQDLGSPLNDSPNLGEFTQDLGKATQDLGKTPQDLGLHIRNNQPNNQTMEPERRSLTPFEEFKRLFPEQASIHAETVIGAAGVENLPMWRATLEAWKVNRYSVRNLAGIIENYQKRAEKVLQQGGSSYDQERQRRARRFLERTRTDLAAKYGHRR